MLGRGKRSASDKKKPDAKSDKATKAEKAAKAAELAEEAAERAREAARLAQIAADEAAEAEEPAKSTEKPRESAKLSEVDPTPENAAEDDSAASEDDSTTSEPPEAEADETDEAVGEVEEVEAEEVDAEDDEADEADDEDEPAEPKRLKLKKAARTEESDDDGEPRRARLGFSTVIAVLAVLTIALGAGTTVLGLKVKEQRATQQAAKEATFASSHAAQKMSSYDYRTLDTDLKAASALTTGKLHTQYGKLADQLKTVAVQQQAVSNTTVMKIGVVSATPDKVVTLVYANRSSATKSDKEQRLPEPLRIKMTMVKKDGKWLASEVTVLS
jgi:Mce-associated membrane protein